MDSKHKYRYLVVEDEYLIRKNIIKKIQSLPLPLRLAGEASNGAAAQALLEKELPHIVITDIRMPGYDGLELARHIHERYPKIKTIILSGYSDFSYAQKSIRYQVKDYLLKPVTTEALQTSLQHLLLVLDSENEKIVATGTDAYAFSHQDICELMVSYMRQHYQSDLILGELAEQIGYSPEYLGKIFKKHMGETPSKYLASLRLNEAKYLLVNHPELDIHKVGENVGYKDASYFSRLFKSHVGVYPSEYRMENVASTPKSGI